MRSMTGFGRSTGDNGRWAAVVTVKSVNGKNLDLQLNLRGLSSPPLELSLRELVAQRLHRGRVDASVELRPLGERGGLHIDAELVRAFRKACRPLIEEGLVEPQLSQGELLRWAGAVSTEEAAWAAEDSAWLLPLAGKAIDQLVTAREREGLELVTALGEKIERLAELVELLARLRSVAREEAVASLRKRLNELLEVVPVDEARLAQEAAILADRLDVSEEVDRLRGHLAHFWETAEAEGPVGKRLDFLLQEVFRELNTLGSKCRHPDVVRKVLDAKVLVEQLREQVQNVE